MVKAVFLDFEKDLGEIYKKMEELENKELETGVSENEALSELKRKMRTRTAEIYADLTPWQTALVARHPNRPYTLDYIDAILRISTSCTAIVPLPTIRASWAVWRVWANTP